MEPTWETDQVPDRHRDPTVTTRPTKQVKEQAEAVLDKHNLTIQAYLLACIAELLADPERRVREVQPYVPPPKPIGRPPKKRTPGEDPH